MAAMTPTCIVLAALSSLAIAAAPNGQIPRPSGSPPGMLIDIGTHKLHLVCAGPERAKPVVILEAGGGAYSTTWAAVQKALAPRVRTCAYDRAGLGWSEDGPAPRTMKQEVRELHALLAAAKIAPPYVMTGHSIGAVLVRLYTDEYPNEVSGVVLAAAMHESGRFGVIGKGWVRVRDDPSQTYFDGELQRLYMARRENREPLGDRPLIVLAPMRQDPPPPGTSDDLWSELRVEKDDQAMGLMLLSTNSKVIRDRTSGHQIQTDNPTLVARAIEQVIEAVVRGTRLE
jgi:pimeloyl-ACP methyl ester carboxylesterase